MAGLIEQKMGAEPAAEQEVEQDMPMPQGAAMAEEEGPDESDPTYQAAIDYAMEALYAKEAAKDISQQLKAAPNLVEGMAQIAYDITAVVDERTDGQVPDELLMPLAMKILEEVVEIADASALHPQPEDVAGAFRQMTIRYLQEQGIDTTQLDAAMKKIDPSVFRQASEENTEEVPA